MNKYQDPRFTSQTIQTNLILIEALTQVYNTLPECSVKEQVALEMSQLLHEVETMYQLNYISYFKYNTTTKSEMN
jgi:hypothetical protein